MAKALYLVDAYLGLVLVVATYLLNWPAPQLVPDDIRPTSAGVLLAAWGAVVLLWLVSVVLLIRETVVEFRGADAVVLRRSMRNLKFGMVPFFVLNFVHLGAFFWLFAAFTLGSGALLFQFPIAFTYAIFLPTSLPGLAYLMHLFRERTIDAGWYSVLSLLNFVFVGDVLGTGALLWRTRPGGRRQIDPGPTAPAW